MKSTFISHSWHDKRLAKLIASALQQAGGRVWLDDAEVKLGDSLVEKIRAGIDNVDYVVALISKNSVASEWVSRELDIAMNQEIEGRRVKVLPVLASKCSLPGFLQGKLYADMSSPKAIRRSLPLLLERLEAPREVIAQVRAGKLKNNLSGSGWVAELAQELSSTDHTIRYEALKRAERWRAKDLLANLETLELIFGLLDKSSGVHVRVRALSLIQGIEDNAFAYRIEPLLDDTTPQVVAAAVNCLAGLKSSGSAMRVLAALSDSCPPEVLRVSLEFFSKVEIEDESVVLSLVAACDQLTRQHPSDAGLRLATLKAFANQLSSGPALALVPPVIDGLSSGPDAIRLALLELICEKGEMILWIPYAPNLRASVGRAVIECAKSSTPQVAAAGWLVMLLLPDISPVLSVRGSLWELVGVADEETLACWFEKLADYSVGALFDQENDVAGLSSILRRFGGRFDEEVCDILGQIGSYAALKVLSKANYEPNGWAKVATLRALASLDAWDPELSGLLDASKSDLPNYIGSTGRAWALLAELKAECLDVKTFLECFPVNLREKGDEEKSERRKIAALVSGIKKRSAKSYGRRLATILKNLGA
jgi:HEAT repeat protein